MCVSRVSVIVAAAVRYPPLSPESRKYHQGCGAHVMQMTEDGAEPPSQCGFSADPAGGQLAAVPPPRNIPESALSALRGILVSSLYRGDRDDEAPVPPARHFPRDASGGSPSRRPGRHVTFDPSAADDYDATGTLAQRPLCYQLIIL